MKTAESMDFVINIATVNGSGSQTANTVLLRSLFRMGMPVGGKNIFPSNIQGLPTWFWIRTHPQGFVGAKKEANIVVAMNPQTFTEDQKTLVQGGFLFYSQERIVNPEIRADLVAVPLPLQKLSESIEAPLKIKKLASNMIYVGVLSELLQMPAATVRQVISDILGAKASALQSNLQAFEVGREFAKNNLQALRWPFRTEQRPVAEERVLMDGNTASALGLVAGGCQFVSWYPITPSTSVVESFAKFAEKIRKDSEGKNQFAVVQSEDELSAFSMVLGAGWAGTRAMTATSGPGLSLMAEGAGYAYYAEIPSVIWNVQRLGPSTGLPTRTAQGDVLFSATLSHGDTRQVLLFPGNITECFEFGQICFDLAERLQQLVIVLSDLDLGMNLWTSPVLKPLSTPLDRGKIRRESDLLGAGPFHRYEDVDGDGIAARTLPGNTEAKAAYFTRGSGHNAKAQYSEKASEYESNMRRLEKKWETAKQLVPKAEIQNRKGRRGLLYYGSTSAVIEELCDQLPEAWNLCRVRAFPFGAEVEEFLRSHETVYVLEQNRDGQMKSLLVQSFPQLAAKMKSLLHFDGTPVTALGVIELMKEQGVLQ